MDSENKEEFHIHEYGGCYDIEGMLLVACRGCDELIHQVDLDGTFGKTYQLTDSGR